MNLYEIDTTLAVRMIELGEMLDNGETPSQEFIDECLDLQNDLENKLVNCGKFIKNAQVDIDGLDGEIKRLTAKKQSLQKRTDLIKANMLSAMLTHNLDKIADPIMPIRVQTNGKASVLVDDVASLPSQFQTIKVEANKTALEQAIKAGEIIDGVRIEKGKHIRIG